MPDRTLEVRNPGSGELLGTVPEARADDVPALVANARRGQEVMAAMPAHRRQTLLLRVADLIATLEELARLDVSENGSR